MTATHKTTAELADLFECSTRTIRDLARRGVIVSAGRGRYDPDASTRSYVRHLREMAAGRGGDAGVELSHQRARLASEQADALAMRNSITRGEYLKADEIERQWAEDCCSIQAHLLSVPTKIGARLGLERREINIVDDLVRAALNEAADRVEADARVKQAEDAGC